MILFQINLCAVKNKYIRFFFFIQIPTNILQHLDSRIFKTFKIITFNTKSVLVYGYNNIY